jgi:hypothetical protein
VLPLDGALIAALRGRNQQLGIAASVENVSGMSTEAPLNLNNRRDNPRVLGELDTSIREPIAAV